MTLIVVVGVDYQQNKTPSIQISKDLLRRGHRRYKINLSKDLNSISNGLSLSMFLRQITKNFKDLHF